MAQKHRKTRKKTAKDTRLDTPKPSPELQADPGEGGVGAAQTGGAGDPLQQLPEILIPNGDYDEDRLSEALGVPCSTIIQQRCQLGLEVRIAVDGPVLLDATSIGLLLVALGVCKKNPAGALVAPLAPDLQNLLKQSLYATQEPQEPRQAFVCGFPTNEYLVQFRWPTEAKPINRRYARVKVAARKNMRHGKELALYPPIRGNVWETKKPRRK